MNNLKTKEKIKDSEKLVEKSGIPSKTTPIQGTKSNLTADSEKSLDEIFKKFEKDKCSRSYRPTQRGSSIKILRYHIESEDWNQLKSEIKQKIKELEKELIELKQDYRDYYFFVDENKELKKKIKGPLKVAPSTITETKGLPKKERIQLLKTAERKDIGSRKIREYVNAIKKAPKPIKKEILKGELEPEDVETISDIEDEEILEETIEQIKKMKDLSKIISTDYATEPKIAKILNN